MNRCIILSFATQNQVVVELTVTMAEVSCELLEIDLTENERSLRFDLPGEINPAAGQYLLGVVLEKEDILATTLFMAGRSDRGVILTGNPPAGWVPGDRVVLRGPFGRGFRLPANARRVGVVSLSGRVSRLLPLISSALAHKAAVSLFSQHVPASLPAEVEVLPVEGLSDGWKWADYIGIEADFAQLNGLRGHLRLGEAARPPCPAEIMVGAEYPCGGIAECGVCSVKSGGRIRLACKDGPVFELDTLEF